MARCALTITERDRTADAGSGSTARNESAPASGALHVRFGEFELDETNAVLRRDRSAIPLPPTPFGVLCALVRQAGSLVTKHALLDRVWGHRFVSDSVLKTAISTLRAALADDPRQPRYIETVARRGYRFVAAPTALSDAIRPHVADLKIGDPQVPPLIGRSMELARLRRAWNSASEGKRAVVWIAGESGIGKTTLMEHFVATLGDIACVRGHCVRHAGTGEQYLPILEALAELCRSDATVHSLLRTVAPTWLLQLPWIGTPEERESLHRELAGVQRERMLREMCEFLDRYTERRPLLLLTEDLHWADSATTQLIDYIARRRGSGRLMWVSTFRLAEVVASEHPLNALRRELRLQDLCQEIVLDPFSEAEVAAFVAERSPSMAGDGSFVRALHDRTDGVPLFLASIMSAAAAEAGPTAIRSAAHIANATVPERLRTIVDHYVGTLGHERRRLLSAAAVCGTEFRPDTLSRVLQCDVAWVADTCDQLAREQLWLAARDTQQPADPYEKSYAFRRALFREVLCECTTPSTRAELHCRNAAAMKEQRSAARNAAAPALALDSRVRS